MIKFEHYVYQDKRDLKIVFYGELFFENYPVNLQEINKDYLEDAIIRSFQPFLQIQKPIDQNPNFKDFRMRPSADVWTRNGYKIVFDIKILSPNSKEWIYVRVEHNTLNKKVLLFYSTGKFFREASRKRYREEVEEEEFLQNVLNAMTRLLNTIIKDYTMMSSLVLREGTGKFIGRAETSVAEFLGANRSIVKDGK
jgi:hypothetical protein